MAKETNLPCRNTQLVDGTYCQYHSPLPQFVSRRKAVATLGGKKQRGSLSIAKDIDISTMKGLHEYVGLTLQAAVRGELRLTDNYTRNFIAMCKLYMETSNSYIDTMMNELEKKQKE